MNSKTISEDISEVLESLWTQEEKQARPADNGILYVSPEISDELLFKLQKDQLVISDSSNRTRLSEKGRALAEQIIRRHRLAERLICDVLGSHVDESENAACEFEHLLAEGITNSICTLLGHPRFCPHNSPIPEGDCCRQARDELKPIVISCEQLNIGESGRIAYMTTREHARLMKLSALGISPGIKLKLLQKWPSFVVQCDETEIALDRDVARNIYLWHTQQ
jgi:DtxR family transcriptional regulator, Mn-dependent transcriptional regulator